MLLVCIIDSNMLTQRSIFLCQAKTQMKLNSRVHTLCFMSFSKMFALCIALCNVSLWFAWIWFKNMSVYKSVMPNCNVINCFNNLIEQLFFSVIFTAIFHIYCCFDSLICAAQGVTFLKQQTPMCISTIRCPLPTA